MPAACNKQLDQRMGAQERIKELAAMINKQVDNWRSHELKFWRAYNESGVVGTMQMANTACLILSIQATSWLIRACFQQEWTGNQEAQG